MIINKVKYFMLFIFSKTTYFTTYDSIIVYFLLSCGQVRCHGWHSFLHTFSSTCKPRWIQSFIEGTLHVFSLSVRFLQEMSTRYIEGIFSSIREGYISTVSAGVWSNGTNKAT